METTVIVAVALTTAALAAGGVLVLLGAIVAFAFTRRRRPPEADPGTRANIPAWALVGTGGAALGAGLIVGVLALGAEKDFREVCPENREVCDPATKSKQKKAEDLALASDVLWIGGTVTAAAGALWLVLGADRQSSAAAGPKPALAHPDVVVTRHGGAVTIGGAF